MSYFNLDIHACYARSNATCRMGLKSTPKFTKLRFKKSYKAETTARVIKQVDRGFAGAAGDLKYIDFPVKAYTIDATGSMYHIDVVPQNTTVNGRTGKSWRNTSLQLRGTLSQGNNAGGLIQKYALYLVWDNQPEQALPAITDIVQAPLAASQLINRDNASRFKVIRRWTGTMTGNLSGAATLVTPTTIINIDEFIKLPKDCVAVCTAADATGAIANRITGALYLFTLGDYTGAAASQGSLGGRLNFLDL